MMLPLERGQRIDREQILRKLVEIQYERNDHDFEPRRLPRPRRHRRGLPLVRGERAADRALRRRGRRAEHVRSADRQDASAGTTRSRSTRRRTSSRRARRPSWRSRRIKAELEWYRTQLETEGKVLEAHRLHQRTMFDLEMIKEIGYCHGIENYARHLTGRQPGEPPPTLLDYLPPDALTIVDESHQTVPQVRGMYHGDRSRKEVLVAYGFRLPSALDNRPLNFEEWEERVGQVLFVSATPGPYELRQSGGAVVEQIIRPTGLVDPPIDIRPVKGQIDDLLAEIRDRAARSERVLVTTLTKRMAEDLTHVLPGARRQGALPPLRHRDARAHRDPARSAPRDLRRAGRHQPAARGARPARSLAGGHPRRRQGRVPALVGIADPDHRPRRAQRAMGGRSCTPTR